MFSFKREIRKYNNFKIWMETYNFYDTEYQFTKDFL